MAVVHKSFRGAKRAIVMELRHREKALDKALRKTARKGASHVRRNVPVAFSELRDSVRAARDSIIADAPHAAAVELGSRPHMPPLEPLIKWVKLRGMQGLNRRGNVVRGASRLPGTTTEQWAIGIAKLIRDHEKHGAVGADVPRQIAWAIAMGIKKHGTKPHHYMSGSIPKVMEILDQQVAAVFKAPVGKV